MKNVIIRTISGIIYIGVMVGAFLAGGAWLAVLLSVLCVLGINEFISITKEGKFPRLIGSLVFGSGVMTILTSFFVFSGEMHTARTLGLILLAFYLALTIGHIYIHNDNAVNALARSLMSLLYVAMPLALVPALYFTFATPHILLAILIFIWVNDTGAFCVGCLFGRHKLFERISPKKTWEGFFGGLLFCVIAAFVMRGCFEQYYAGLSYGDMCRLSIVVSVFATFGDLLESLIKRTYGVKDSGNLIPGHGGILDRIDSLLLVIPASLFYLILTI